MPLPTHKRLTAGGITGKKRSRLQSRILQDEEPFSPVLEKVGRADLFDPIRESHCAESYGGGD